MNHEPFRQTITDGPGGEYLSAIGKASPPLAVSGATAAGMTLQDWVLVATLAYTILQAAYLIYKILRDHRQDKGRNDG